jgi:uncharacterized protein (DUF486 family)
VCLAGIGSIIHFLLPGPADDIGGYISRARDCVYLCFGYIIASRLRWTEDRFLKCMWFMLAMAAMAVILGLLQMYLIPTALRLMRQGASYTALKDLQDVTLLAFAQFWLFAFLCSPIRIKAWWGPVLLCAAVYGFFATIASGSLTAVVLYPILLAAMWAYYKTFRSPALLTGVLVGAAAAAVGILFVLVAGAESSGSVLRQFTSHSQSVDTREVEVLNLASNLLERGAPEFGIGLGSKWHEDVPQPPDDGAWPPEEIGSTWHIGMHSPGERTLLDFGVLGLFMIWGSFWLAFRHSQKVMKIRAKNPLTMTFACGIWAAITFPMVVGDLTGAKATLLCGLLLGIMLGLADDLERDAQATVKSDDAA